MLHNPYMFILLTWPNLKESLHLNEYLLLLWYLYYSLSGHSQKIGLKKNKHGDFLTLFSKYSIVS